MARGLAALLALCLLTASESPTTAPLDQRQPAAVPLPNIVLIFPDNLGWGEVGAFGSVRGDITPRLDKNATEG